MDEGREGSIKDLAIGRFVQDAWVDFVGIIGQTKIQEDDFLLCLMWVLDSIKDTGLDCAKKFWNNNYNALRNFMLKRGEETGTEAMNGMTNLVCACSLACYGLSIVDNSDNQSIYSAIVSSLEGHSCDVQRIKWKIESVYFTKELKNWVVSYLKSEKYYTLGGEIAWDKENPQALTTIYRKSDSLTVFKNAQVNIQTFNNEPGAIYNDNGVTINNNG